MLVNKDKPYYKLFLNKKIAIIEDFCTEIEKRRYSYSQLMDYVNRTKNEKVCALVGLRRTGKTTEMLQCADELKKQGKKVLFLTVAEPKEKDLTKYPENLVQISDLYNIIDDAQEEGYQVIFIDEITYVNDFLYANLLANKYALKTPIIISGTDSLGFEIASKNALYDRIKKIPTSYISFEEFNYLLPEKTLDDYIKFGGTLHDESPYKEKQSAVDYINTAIAGNIIHALKFEEVDREYEALTDLYKSNTLKGAIQKLTNKAGQNIAIRAIKKEYESSPIRTTLKNLSKDDSEPSFDLALAKKSNTLTIIEDELRKIFEIKLNSELGKEFKDSDYAELKKYLYEIGLLYQIPVYKELSQHEIIEDSPKEILLQPGMLYCHAQEALKTLTLHEKVFDDWHIENKSQFMERLDRQTKGDILESIVLYDTYKSFPAIKGVNDTNHYYVSKLRLENEFYLGQNLSGKEIDVLIREPFTNDIYLFEVKYSEEKIPEQTKNLTDKVFLDYIEQKFNGRIKNRAVIYNGKTDLTDEIKYINASNYLIQIRHVDNLNELFLVSKAKQNNNFAKSDTLTGISAEETISDTDDFGNR